MFTLAGAAIAQFKALELLALVVFLLGVGLLFFAILVTALDFRRSHQVVESEVRRVFQLNSAATSHDKLS